MCRCSRVSKEVLIIDDDIVRAHSTKFEENTGIPLVNIPAKGMGAPQHVCVAMPSGFFIGGHFSTKYEGCLEAVKVILLDIAGSTVKLESQTYKQIRNIIALDRGYQTEELLNQLHEWGCRVLGTLKRCKFAPFCYGDDCKSYAHQTKLDKRGPRVDMYMKQNYHCFKGHTTTSIAGVHRTGLGKCFMTHTTVPEYGPHKFTVTLKSGKIYDTAWSPSFAPLLVDVLALTIDERSPTWFQLRQFIFSSTSSFMCLCMKAKHVHVTGANVTPAGHILVLDTLGITRHTASLGDYDLDVEELIDISNESIESLQRFTSAQLVVLCQQRRLPYSGNKLHLAERLLFHEVTSTDPGDVIGDLLKCCFFRACLD